MPIEQSISYLAKKTILLADPNARSRGQLTRYLRSIGMEVIEASTADEACDRLAVSTPVLAVVDVELAGDTRRFLLAAGETRQGETTKVLLTLRARTAREAIIAKVTPAVGGALVTPCRPELIIERLARLLVPVSVEQAADNPISVVPGNNSLLLQQVLCPFHEQQTPARRFALRMNHLESEPNFFDVPVYTHAIGHADYVNFHQLCVTVCPDCLFASPDPGHFHASAAKRASAAPLSPAARYAIISRTHQRRELLGEASSDTFFNEHRTHEQAVKSFELAMHCSVSLHGAAPRQYAREPVRQGNYQLRLALLREQMGHSLSTREAHIEKANQILKETFLNLSEEQIPRSVYQVVATSIYLGQDRDAHQYMTQLARYTKQARDPKVRTQMDKYLARSAEAWENRDQHRRRADAPVRRPAMAAAAAGGTFMASPFAADAAAQDLIAPFLNN